MKKNLYIFYYFANILKNIYIKMSDEEKKIMEEFEKQINEEKKIVEALNSLNEKALKNYYPKLEIQQKNKFII